MPLDIKNRTYTDAGPRRRFLYVDFDVGSTGTRCGLRGLSLHAKSMGNDILEGFGLCRQRQILPSVATFPKLSSGNSRAAIESCHEAIRIPIIMHGLTRQYIK